MLKSNSIKTKAVKLAAITLTLTTIANSFVSVSAKPNNLNNNKPYNYPSKIESNRNRNNVNRQRFNNNAQNNRRFKNNNRNRRFYSANLFTGTVIPTIYPEAKKILVTKDETMPVTLEVARNIRDGSGQIVIPRGSQIIGEIRPASGGSRFVADTLVLRNGEQVYINANSPIISRTENISGGRNTDAIWQGAAAGAAAATIIAGVTGDTAIATEEVLGGAGVGALAGFLFGGNREDKELVSIDTQQDLDLTLTSDLSF